MNPPTNVDRLVVYTVLMGQAAELNPVPASTTTDYVCFTDQKISQPNGWTVRLVEPLIPGDSAVSSRHPKVNPHLYLKDYSRSIYIDSSVRLLKDPENLWNRLMPKPEILIGAIHHSFHFTIMEEIRAISALGYESDAVMLKHLELSEQESPDYLNTRTIWGGILSRRHNHKDLIDPMNSWFSKILNSSKRDQLSLPLALKKLRGDQVHITHMDNHTSDFHAWPSGGYQKPPSSVNLEIPKHGLSLPEKPASDALLTQRDALLFERDALLFERNALLNSTSWRVTIPLRYLGRFWHRLQQKHQ
jgi:hypothetical protein